MGLSLQLNSFNANISPGEGSVSIETPYGSDRRVVRMCDEDCAPCRPSLVHLENHIYTPDGHVYIKAK